jgi:diamine N-acetyltransferase
MVSLRAIDKNNWKACAELKISASQKDFLPNNLYSIAESQFYKGSCSRAIYANSDLVGYALYGLDEATSHWKIFRLMIDARFQGKGYGREVMKLILEDIRQEKAKVVLVRYNLENEIARKLYEGFGFREISRTETHATAQCLLD